MYLDTKVAVKQMFVESFGKGVLEEFQREVGLMMRLEHAHLVALLGVVERLPKLLIVTELMERGSLWDIYHQVLLLAIYSLATY